MRESVCDVAVSLDGFITGPGDDTAAFPAEGDHVAAYHDRLRGYGTAVMGRRTYEFGYRFGLRPDARAYPHMDHHVFSRSLDLPEPSEVVVRRDGWRAHVERLRGREGRRSISAAAGPSPEGGADPPRRRRAAPLGLGRGARP